MMREIGGFFGLEDGKYKEYHSGDNILKLNNARNSLRYLIRMYSYKTMYVPFYICDSVLNMLKEENIDILFYEINEKFMPINLYAFNSEIPFLYINYFGICEKNIEEISKINSRIIVDNSQGFFTKLTNHTAFNSCRKFFGVPDGAYLNINDNELRESSKIDAKERSYDRVEYILKRTDLSASEAYDDFKENELYHDKVEVMTMSNLTEKMLMLIDYDNVKMKRTTNFKRLHELLSKYNELFIDKEMSKYSPLCYPFLISNDGVREILTSKKIYVARYWPNILDLDKNKFEYKLGKYLLPLPIDQRYDTKDMEYIVNILLEYLDKN